MTTPTSEVCTCTILLTFVSLLAIENFCKIDKEVPDGESPLSHSIGLTILADLSA